MCEQRTLDELIIADSTVWQRIRSWAREGPNTVLPISRADGEAQLLALQMSTMTSPGALTLECGGILADHGWLKLFGGGTADMPAFLDLMTPGLRAGMCAIDVLGGVFALNWGAFPGAHHRIWYWAPDTLAWLECGEWTHFDLVWSALTGGLDRFYEDLRWPGWQDDVAQLDADQGYTLMPQPFSVEGRDVALSHKAVVPMAEICRVMYMFTGPGGVFDGTSDRYPMFWLRGPHARPDIDRFTD